MRMVHTTGKAQGRLGKGLFSPAASGPEYVKTPGQTLAMISENFIAREPHETVYPG